MNDGDVVGRELLVGLVVEVGAHTRVGFLVGRVQQRVDLGILDLCVVLARVVALPRLGQALRALGPGSPTTSRSRCRYTGRDPPTQAKISVSKSNPTNVGVEDVGRVLDRELHADLLELLLHDLLDRIRAWLPDGRADGERPAWSCPSPAHRRTRASNRRRRGWRWPASTSPDAG